VYLEASRHLAYRMQKESGNQNNVKEWIAKGYQVMMHKPIPPAKLKILEDLYTTVYASLKLDKEKTCEMIGVDDEHNNPHTAALVVVANAMLNLDEMITKN
jgi:hypothetical protein